MQLFSAFPRLINRSLNLEIMDLEKSLDDIYFRLEKYIKKVGRTAGKPLLTVYYVLKADSTPDEEKSKIKLALIAVLFPVSLSDFIGHLLWLGKGAAAVYAYDLVRKYITPFIEMQVEAKLDEWFNEGVTEIKSEGL